MVTATDIHLTQVVQDGYQSLLNLRTVLNLIGARHQRIKTCSRYPQPYIITTLAPTRNPHPNTTPPPPVARRETDGAGSYNSVCVALMTLQLGHGGKSGTIKVVEHAHNEPGHGADICDTAGVST